MGDAGDQKNKTVKQIFETMEYGEEVEKNGEVTEWLKSKKKGIFAYIDKKDESPNGEGLPIKNANNEETLCTVYVPEAATVETILTKSGEAKNAWIETAPIKRAGIIYKFGNEIEKKQDLITQLEAGARGILSKDTRNKALPLLTDYLRYYSSFTVKYKTENSSWKPEGIAVCILPDESPLSLLGCILGPALASGYHLILQTGPRLTLLTALLIEIAIQAGIPEGTIRLIPGSIDPSIVFNHAKVAIVSIFDDLYKEKYLIANHFNKKLLHFYSSGVPMIVFENCDVDSACHGVIDAVWGHKGMLPWSVKNIYIQENIFDTFIQKLKDKISHVKVDKSHKKNVDISAPDDAGSDKISQVIEKAKGEGVEVFQINNKNVPALLIGGNIFHNNVIKEDFNNLPIVTLTAFRNINEAVALSNNTRHGLGVSVWSESTSLVNEIIGKLKTGNIWVNSHGLFAADVPTSPHKTSGNAYFGGKDGFSEYVQSKPSRNEPISQISNGEAMEKAIAEAKKAQDAWFKLSRLERIKNLQTIALGMNTNKETWIENWVHSIHDYILNGSLENFTRKNGFNVVSTREPYGVIAIETPEDKEIHGKKTIIAALAEGNSVIILNDSKEATTFYSLLSKSLPKGVFAVIPHSQDATKVAALHKELNLYIGEKNNKVFFSLPLKTSSKFKTA